MKIKKIFIIISILVVFILVTYLIIVDLVLKSKVLPGLSYNGEKVTFFTEQEIRDKFESNLVSTLPQTVTFSFEDKDYQIETTKLQPVLNLDAVMNYGKGDPIKALTEFFSLAKGVDLATEYSINANEIVALLPFKLSKEHPAKDVNGDILNCSYNEYDFDIDNNKLNKIITNALISNQKVSFDVGAIIKNPIDNFLYQFCTTYKAQLANIKKAFAVGKFGDSFNPEEILIFHHDQDITTWRINSPLAFSKIMYQIKTNTDLPLKQGRYEDHGDIIYLFEPYQGSKTLELKKSLVDINDWLKSPTDSLPITYTEVQPDITATTKQIYDFSYKYGEGKSRINLVFCNSWTCWENPFVENSRVGLQEADGLIIHAGEEFSLYGLLQPSLSDTWRTKSGRIIDSGICNSSTTLFRTALEMGFPILERANHAFNVPKYAWDYPMNLVDAAYLTNPKVDMRFRNDFDYPIYLKVSFWRDNDYEYQKIELYTSPNAPKRTIQLSNWKEWDIKVQDSIFKGSFDRTVYQDGNVIRQDSFYSDYTIPYG